MQPPNYPLQSELQTWFIIQISELFLKYVLLHQALIMQFDVRSYQGNGLNIQILEVFSLSVR